MKKIDKRDSIRVDTHNAFITASGLDGISLKARKLLYIAIAQCKLNDKEFFEYVITIQEFSNMMGIDSSNVYEEAEKICDELAKGFIKVKFDKKNIKRRKLFNHCDNTYNGIIFQLNSEMVNLLLELKGSFTKPLLQDFLKMRSPYSMAIWHLMQREMPKSKKPYADELIEFELTLEELRQVTGTENKLKQISEFKNNILDKALREIKDNCGVNITYKNIKTNRKVTGFHFIAVSPRYIKLEDLSLETLEKIERIKEKQK